MSMPSISQLSPFFQMAQTGINQLGQGINQGFQTQNDMQLADALSKGDYAGAMQAAARSGNVNAVLELQKLNQQQTLQKQLSGDMGNLGSVFGGAGAATTGATSSPSAASTTPAKVTPGYGVGYEASGMSKQDVASYIQSAASARGIDPTIALKVAASEGLNSYVGDKAIGGSYGPYQLFMGGGLGNEALKHGIDPRDPSTVKQQIDFALDTAAAKGSWGDWNGAKAMGITTQGLQNAKPIGISAAPAPAPGTATSATPARPMAGLNLPAVAGPQAGAQPAELGPGYGLSPPAPPPATPPLPPTAGFDQATPIAPPPPPPAASVTPTGMPAYPDESVRGMGTGTPTGTPPAPLPTPVRAAPAPVQGPPGPVTPGQAPNPNAITIGNAALSRPGFDPVVAPFARGTRAQPYSYSPSGLPGTVALGAGGVSPVPTPGAGSAYAALPPAGGAPSAAAAAPAATPATGGYDQDKANAFQNAIPQSIEDEDKTTGAFDLSDDPDAMAWARKNGAQYGYKEDPNSAGTFIPVGAGAGATTGAAAPSKADAAASTVTQVASTPVDRNVTPAQAQTVGQSIAVHPGLSNDQKAAYLTGLAIKYSQLPGVGTMFGQMAQHFLQQSDMTNDEKEYMFSVGQGYKGNFMKWKADQQAAQRAPSGQQNLEYAKQNWQQLGLPNPDSTDPKDQAIWRDYATKALGLSAQPLVQIDQRGQSKAAELALTGIQKSYEGVGTAVPQLTALNDMQRQINDPHGIIHGWGNNQDAMMATATWLSNLGIGDPNKLSNTQEFMRDVANETVQIAKANFPQRVTNADLTMSKLVSGTDPSQQMQAIQMAIQMRRDLLMQQIDRHNDAVERYVKAFPDQGNIRDLYHVDPSQLPPATAPTQPVRIPPGMSPADIDKKYPKGTPLILPDGSPGVVQ